MKLFAEDSEQARAWDQVMSSGGGNKANITHEIIAAAASYEAAKALQDHYEKNGKPQSHETAKNLFAGFLGAAITHIAETKGHDYIDRKKAERDAEKHAADALASHY